MRENKKRRTMMRFMFTWIVIFFLITLISSAIMVDYISHRAAEDSISTSLKREMRRAASEKDQYNPLPHYEENDRKATEDCYIVFLETDGTYISGDYPEDCQAAVDAEPLRNGELRTVDSDAGDLYVIDRVFRGRQYSSSLESDSSKKPSESIIRAITYVSTSHTIYHKMQQQYYLIIFLLALLLAAVLLILYRKIMRPMIEMTEKAEKISTSDSFSGHISGGYFYETQVLADAYNHMLDRSGQLISQQEEFNSNVSHELRTPISLIRSECDLIQDLYSADVPEDLIKSLDVIKAQSIKMNSMINELLHFSKVDRNDGLGKTELIDIVDILESVCEDTENMLQGARKLEYDFHSVEAEVDLILIMIAIRNLISNAVKYSHEGSTIWISNDFDRDWIYVSVKDEGIGISRENQKKIFDYYYQVSSGRDSHGFGLGLTLALKIARKHGGDITITSEPDKGSTFTLMLPAKKTTASP